jgi:rhamnose utilization protein RhaD (predicted bifunctional aldolase and dehydrogenase)/NAD(P)-dependent dehydrogenase (short-subunit alcohol dehydrogenase family)
MKNLWSEIEAQKFNDNPLKLRVYSSRVLGQEPDLVLHGGGNTSVKITEKDIFGENEEILYVKGSGWDLATIEKAGFAPVKLKVLQYMAGFDSLSDLEMVKLQRAAMTNPYAPNPSIEAILHAIIPFKYVDHTHADAVVTITNTPGGEERIKEIYGNKFLIVPYVMPGFILAKKIHELTKNMDWASCEGMILLNHGVFTFSDDAKKSYDKMIDIVSQAEAYLEQKNAIVSIARMEKKENLLQLAKIRKSVSVTKGKALLALLDGSDEAVSFSALSNVEDITSRGPLTPDHIIRTKRTPALIKTNHEEDIVSYTEAYKAYFDRNNNGSQICLDLAPRWAVWQNHGLVSFGSTLKEAGIISDIKAHTIKAIQQAEKLGGWNALPEKDLFDMEYWELEQAKLKKGGSAPEFHGKIALVTGAASGIGKACVEALAEKGAVVAALDINSEIKTKFESNGILGLICDVTDKGNLQKAVEATIRAFGGLDIIVSNAGIFTANEKIEALKEETWQKGMNINLTSHYHLLKECIPYLKEGIDPAIVIIASKNVPAPGPGAAAYSSAKAGLTQLARVAALELGDDGIRVNVIHPNAVFDTAVWTEDMLKGRAASYGITIEEYKSNNVLHTEVTSRNVAEMACAMAGKTFAKTTGAQVAVDGGNERVI